MRNKDFTDMPVWQQGLKLVKNIYAITREFPSEEKFGLISDMRRAATSIPNNIAEGYGRFEPKDKTRFYKISRGSCYEIHSQLLISKELNYLKNNIDEKLIEQLQLIIKELNKLIKSIELKTSKATAAANKP
jgi:four helix bundle protein